MAASIVHRPSSYHVPPRGLYLPQEALCQAGVPIEEGERCHVCDQPAVLMARHLAWCKQCGVVQALSRGVTVMEDHPKVGVRPHAREHAYPWHKFVRELQAWQDGAAVVERHG